MHLESTMFIKADTPIEPIGDMTGTLRVGIIGTGVIFYTALMPLEEAIIKWEQFRDACQEQVNRLHLSIVDKQALEPPSEENLKLAEAMIAAGEFDDTVTVNAVKEDGHTYYRDFPELKPIDKVVKIPAPLGDEPF
jgi:hypothetical protein